MDSTHIQHQITEYVLDLLPAEEKQAAAHHIAGCDQCRQAVQQERELGRLVHSTINSATTAQPGRLQSLMPAIPDRRSPVPALLAPLRRWDTRRQWAIACLLLVAVMGAFLFGGSNPYSLLTRPADNQAATLSSVITAGTAQNMTTSEAGTLFSLAAQATVPVEQSPVFINSGPGQNNPPAAPLPVAPQVTPAPAATYFQ